MKIPLVDLKAQHESIRGELDAAMRGVIERSAFITGPEGKAFEAEFAAYCGAKACAGVGNGTDALYLALRALGVGPGDEVVTVAHTFAATAEAILLAGARPVFVEILSDTMLMDPAAFERAISPKTKAVIPVHLYGQPCRMDEIRAIADRRGLKVIEDAAQAHGATFKGRRVGTLGHAACFSFYPGKNLGAYGDAGAVVSDDTAFIERVRSLANHGRLDKYRHREPGVNSRLDELQAAVLRVKLRHLEAWNARRRKLAAKYLKALKGGSVELPAVADGADPVWHLFVVRTPGRDELQKRLESQGVATGVHYPLPLHLQPAFRSIGPAEGGLPATEKAASEVLSLPMYPELGDEAAEKISAALRGALAAR